MNKLIKFSVPLLATLIFTGCSNRGDVVIKEKSRDLQVQTVENFKDSEDLYNKEVDIAKQYELNAILRLAGTYSWNFLHEGDKLTEDELKPLGVYSQAVLEEKLSISKASVEKKVAEFNSNKLVDNKQQGTPISELQLSKAEKLAYSKISIKYYNLISHDQGYIFSDDKSTGRVMQVITVFSDYGISEYCYTWENDKVVDASGFNNL